MLPNHRDRLLYTERPRYMTLSHSESEETDLTTIIGGRRLIVASNRGPVEFRQAPNGRFVSKRGSGAW